MEDNATLFGIFDKNTSFNLFEYYFLKVFVAYIDVSSRGGRAPLARGVRGARGAREVDAALSDIYSGEFNDSVENNVDDESYATQSPETRAGNTKDAKDIIASLLVAYLNIMMNHKTKVNFTYDSVMDNTFKIQLKEKKTFTDKLEGYTSELRQVDNVLKICKLGDWNKGLQKGLTKYNKNADDDAVRKNNEEYQRLEQQLMKNANVTEQNLQQYMDDYLNDQERGDDIDDAENDMTAIGEEYYNGDPYGEERDPDDN